MQIFHMTWQQYLSQLVDWIIALSFGYWYRGWDDRRKARALKARAVWDSTNADPNMIQAYAAHLVKDCKHANAEIFYTRDPKWPRGKIVGSCGWCSDCGAHSFMGYWQIPKNERQRTKDPAC
jgi:hypothetical protein